MLRYCLLSVVVLFHPLVQASEGGPTLVALELPGLTSSDKEGAFANLYNALQEKSLITSWETAPIFRAHQIFLNRKASCIAPSSLRLLDEYDANPEDMAPLVPFNRVQGYLLKAANYTLKPGEQPSLGVVGIGYLFGIEQSAYKLVNVATYDQLLYLIGESRVSAAYVNFPDVTHHPKAMEILENFEGELELRWDGVDHIMCWKDYAQTRDQIATAIEAWKKDGTLQQMFGKYYIDLGVVE